MVLVASTGPAERPTVRHILRTALLTTWRVAQLGAIKAALLVFMLVPFVALAVLTYVILLSQHDIYFYLKDRPPVFWLAAGIGGLLLLTAVATGMVFYVRWAFALPILLFEKQLARAALRNSQKRVRGVSWQVGFILLGWFVGTLLLGLALAAGFRLLAAAILETAGENPIALTLLLLAIQAGLLAFLSFVTVVGLALITRRLYLHRSEQLGHVHQDGFETTLGTEKPASPWTRRLVYLSAALVVFPPLVLWADVMWSLSARPLALVTAHRGHARAAPENTLSAMRKAIEIGADYAEMDVHQTADGVVVLLHDRDLMRVAGVSRRLDELSYDEVRKLDVGSWFDPSFAHERVPTLEEVINLCRGRIRMNVELKIFGPDRGLAQEVARILREQDVESDCLVTSLNYDALVEVKRHNPRLRTGLTVAHALGNLSRVEVDALSIRTDFLTDEMLRSGQRLGREVHVWTVNDAREMTALMKRGVNNLITSDPELAVRVRDDWASLTPAERLISASRLLLGLEP
jgi:glycerophosphoryl diester phosphodiesterase